MSETLDSPSSRSAVAVRALTYADLPAVISIERRSFDSPWSLAMFVLELSRPAGICLAAEEEGELRGYLICSRYEKLWHLMNVAVDPGHRRRGYATTLIKALLREIDPGERITLEVRASNRGAMRMYQHLGFVPGGARRSYYQDNGEDAIIMRYDTPGAHP